MFGRKILSLALLAGLSQLAQAAERKAAIREGLAGASISSPVMGYFWSEADGLAPVEGMPGAAYVGRPRALSFVPTRVAFPPGQSYVWLEGPGPSLALNGEPAPDTVVAGSDLISFSQNGSAAALYFRAAGRVRLVTGLPDSLTVSATFSAPQFDCD